MKKAKLKIEYIELGKLTPYENNARKHEEEDLATIQSSIDKFGMCDPIGIWSDHNIIVEGHGRLLALEKLGYTEAPCIRLDHLTDEERKQYALAHNKTAEMSKWDFTKLDKELEELRSLDATFDMSKFGFIENESGAGGFFPEELPDFGGEEKPKDYSIVYEIAFNNEEEQSEWYDFLGALRRKYPDVDTIAERILLATRWWRENEAE